MKKGLVLGAILAAAVIAVLASASPSSAGSVGVVPDAAIIAQMAPR